MSHDEIHSKHYGLEKKLSTFIVFILTITILLYGMFKSVEMKNYILSALILLLFLLLIPFLAFEIDRVFWKGG